MNRSFAGVLAGLACLVLAAGAAAQPKTAVSMTLNWYPQGDHGGYFAAKAEGIYEKHGLDVTLRPGGPQVNVHQLLAAGQTDFIMGTQMRTLAARQQGVPIVTIAAFYQKDPTSIMVHEGSGNDTLAALKGKPIFLPGIARNNYWPWAKARFGLTDDQIKPYDPSFRAMSLDRQSGSQGFVTNDIFNCGKLGITCRSLLLSDFGWTAYANTLDTTEKTIQERAEVVRAFVRATNEGWKRYLENPEKAHAAILAMNPQQSVELMNLTHKTMRERGLLDSPDTQGRRYGGMSDGRWEGFYKEMVGVGALPPGIEVRKAYTLQFIRDL